MKFTTQDIESIGKLAKLKFAKKEIVELAKEFDSILCDFDKIYNKDIIGIEDKELENISSPLRRDEVKAFKARETLFQNTKNMAKGHIVLPKIIEER